MINKKTFFKVIDNLRHQYDTDQERAKVLTNIYGSDIDPIDNSLLTESVFLLLSHNFNENQVEDIKIFCYTQNFGRIVNISTEELWLLITKEIIVIDPKNASDKNFMAGEVIQWTLPEKHSKQWGGETFSSAIIYVDEKRSKYIVDAIYGIDKIPFGECKLLKDD